MQNIDKPLIVAGPCSAESEEQVYSTARQLSELGIKYYRAGLWKPRSSPNSFEGIGAKGIEWLQAVKRDFGIKVGTEVAKREHLELIANADIDFVWLGARTITNPFTAQEIADMFADMRLDIPVMVKNPVIPDVTLWIGAVERLHRAGVSQIMAIHRGFYSEGNVGGYRNSPQWGIPIEFKRQKPNIPLICDPSHISGDSRLVESVSIQASKLSFDGLMIEVHDRPEVALSDKNQQITPLQLKLLLEKLKACSELPNDEALSLFRAKIDELDKSLIDIISQRMEISHQIGEYKKINDISILQPSRYEEILANCVKYSQQKEINTDFVRQIIKLIHQESIYKQF